MIDNGGSERSMEYDTVSDKYVQFVDEEVLPRAEKEANVKLSKDPEARLTLGGSSGGAAALSRRSTSSSTRTPSGQAISTTEAIRKRPRPFPRFGDY